jgi:hypothetical protein
MAMGLVRIHIGTTEGPSEIQRLTEEDPGVRSVVCLDGRALALPISRDYESFVRTPTGLIERLWQGAAFRMDVGARITDGLSWQLGAFLAHGLKAAGMLAERGAPAARIVWATGEVDAALAVRPVEEIARKLELSAGLLRGQAASRPLVLVPQDATALAAETLARLGLAESCRLLGVSGADEALAAVDLALPGAARPAAVVKPRRPIRRLRRLPRARLIAAVLAAAILLPLAAIAGQVGWAWHGMMADWTRQAEAGDLIALDAGLTATAATPGCLTCTAAVDHFRGWLAGNAPPDGPVVVAEETARTAFMGCPSGGNAQHRTLTGSAVATSTGVCRVRYVVSGAPEVAVILSAPLLRPGPDAMASGAKETAAALDVPPLQLYPTEQRIVALASRLPLRQALAWLRPQIPPPPVDPPATLIAHLAALGVAARVLHHRIDPGGAL